MARATQFTVSHENLPGMLAHIAKVLGDAQVNILAFLTTTSGREGLTRVVVDRSGTAKKVFANAGLAYTETELLQLELPNTPGALEKFARKLAQEPSFRQSSHRSISSRNHRAFHISVDSRSCSAQTLAESPS